MNELDSPIPVSHIIWDWNGTLIDDTHLCASVVSRVLKEQDLPPIQKEDYRRMFRFPVRDFYDDLGFAGDHEEYLRVCDSFISKYRADWQNCTLHSGATTILERLNDHGITQILLSASHHDHLHENVLHYEIHHHFTAVLGQDNIRAEGKIQRGKTWFEEQQIDPQHILLIGDTNHDYEVAEELGIHCLLYTNGHQDEERLSKYPARKIHYLEDLIHHIRPL